MTVSRRAPFRVRSSTPKPFVCVRRQPRKNHHARDAPTQARCLASCLAILEGYEDRGGNERPTRHGLHQGRIKWCGAHALEPEDSDPPSRGDEVREDTSSLSDDGKAAESAHAIVDKQKSEPFPVKATLPRRGVRD